MNNLIKWADLHDELDFKDDPINKQTYDYGIYVNEHVDYRVIMEIRDYANGSREVEVLDQILQIYDDTANVPVESFDVKLPQKYINQAIDAAEIV